MIRTAVSNPPLAPSIKESKTSTFLYKPPKTIAIKINKINPLLKELEKICTASDSNEWIYKTIDAIKAEIPKIHARITGWKTFIFCLKLTINMDATVAIKVAIIQGMKISIGLADLAAERNAIILTGIIVMPDACKHRNIICGFEAVDFSGLISCKLSMAFNPNGVAALSNPNKFAEKFIIMCPIAG